MATVARILDASAALLDAGGLESVTTNSIAERAGINIATLYGYFPDKYAVLGALAERLDERRNAVIESAMSETASWEEAVAVGLDRIVTLLVSEPGAGALLDAMKVSPRLREAGAGTHERIAKRVERFILDQNPGIGRARVRTMARVLVEASSGVVGLARSATPRERRRVLDEHKRLVGSYLASAGL